MNSKQVVAAIAAIVLIVIIVYPSITSGTVSVSIRASGIKQADHVYVTISGIWAHPAGQSSSGWTSISNKTQTIDLLSIENTTKLLGSGMLSSGSYDSVRIELTNVTWVFNKTTTTLGVTSPELDAPVNFTVGTGSSPSITITLTGEKQLIANSNYFAGTLTASLAT
ncbi:MAG TPA: DUF4382 domain-containing protein [Candidatus Acidoferrales bacterium]|nr:DUF4382 domain-containing protein [Candidatus Acidoferrales bacterium]